jgi:hypothetical protein
MHGTPRSVITTRCRSINHGTGYRDGVAISSSSIDGKHSYMAGQIQIGSLAIRERRIIIGGSCYGWKIVRMEYPFGALIGISRVAVGIQYIISIGSQSSKGEF